MSPGRYAKLLTSAAGLTLTALAPYYGSQHWFAAVIAVAAALGVYAVPNKA